MNLGDIFIVDDSGAADEPTWTAYSNGANGDYLCDAPSLDELVEKLRELFPAHHTYNTITLEL